MKVEKFKPIFVDYIPDIIEPGELYISMKNSFCCHLCACGCGEKVMMPLSKDKGWILLFNGKEVSFTPSIGNFSFTCHSHYYIINNKVEWCVKSKSYSNKRKHSNIQLKLKYRKQEN